MVQIIDVYFINLFRVKDEFKYLEGEGEGDVEGGEGNEDGEKRVSLVGEGKKGSIVEKKGSVVGGEKKGSVIGVEKKGSVMDEKK